MADLPVLHRQEEPPADRLPDFLIDEFKEEDWGISLLVCLALPLLLLLHNVADMLFPLRHP